MVRRRFVRQEATGRDGVATEEAAGAVAESARTGPGVPAEGQRSTPLAQSAPAVPETVVSAGSTWEGKLVTASNVRVEGTVHSEVQTPGSLLVAARARLDSTIMAQETVMAGEIEGEVRCGERLELLGGSLIGDIDPVPLVVHEGAFIKATHLKTAKIEPPKPPVPGKCTAARGPLVQPFSARAPCFAGLRPGSPKPRSGR